MKKKILSGILVLAMMLTMIPTAFAVFTPAGNIITPTGLASGKVAMGVAVSDVGAVTAAADSQDGWVYNYKLTGTLTYASKTITGESAVSNGHFVTLSIPAPAGLVKSSDGKVEKTYTMTVAVDGTVKKTVSEEAENPTVISTFFTESSDNYAANIAAYVTPETKKITVTFKWTEQENGEDVPETQTYNFDTTALVLSKATNALAVSAGAISYTPPAGATETYYWVADIEASECTGLGTALSALTFGSKMSDVETALKNNGVTAKKTSVQPTLTTKDNDSYLIVVSLQNGYVASAAVSSAISNAENEAAALLTVNVDNWDALNSASLKVDSGKDASTMSSTQTTLSSAKNFYSVKFDGPDAYVELEVQAATGYSIDKVTYVENSETKEVAIEGSTHKGVFKMPSAATTVTVTTKKDATYSVTVGNGLTANKNNIVSGTLTWAGSKWTLNIKASLNTNDFTAGQLAAMNIDVLVDGKKTSDSPINPYSNVFTGSDYGIDLTAPAKKLEIKLYDGDKINETWTFDLTNVVFAAATSALTDGDLVVADDVATAVNTLVANGGNTLIINETSDSDDQVEFAAAAVKKIADANNITTVIELKNGLSVTVSPAVMKTLATKSNGVALKVDDSSKTVANLPNGAATLFGSSKIVDVNFYELKVGGTVDTTKTVAVDGTMELTLDFTDTSAATLFTNGTLAIGYVTNEGKTGLIEGSAIKSATGSKVTFVTDHLTMFYLVKVEKTSTPSTPNTGIPTIPGNVPGSTIVTPGKDNNETEDNTMSYDEAVAYVEKLTDVAEKNWFYNEVVWAVQNGVMLGTSKSTFAPNTNMTLYQTLTVLGRFDGEIIDDATWMADAKAWALENGILAKEEDEGDISRERLVYLLYTYAKATGADVSAEGDLSKFTDAAEVSDWAVEAMTWAVGAGIIKGENVNGVDMLNAGGTTTRAQVVTVLMRYADILA